MKPPFNPFVINIYQGKDYFYDRENDLKTLVSHIKNERNVVLYASTVSTALKALEKLELVIKDEEYYLVHEVQLTRWMARL
ncbi:hypothetical protein [Algoriphagus sp. NG3]|uniref:hypothetical protein n=1 Tax=Algoriphagus sp. NG3 TaxID=3097546 RepID=UPI002A82B5DD|nr:hypothetical protein [Algoriphagus sp. NG3]WPR73707.1 hypothetical protein SLW71_13565 [Algoriphagus sp. NG3]